jgi:outer membrane immunogenic protein
VPGDDLVVGTVHHAHKYGVGTFERSGGLEYLFTPSWSGKAEYMYADYGNEAYLIAFAPGGIGLGVTTHTVKAGVNYHFGGPVVARY